MHLHRTYGLLLRQFNWLLLKIISLSLTLNQHVGDYSCFHLYRLSEDLGYLRNHSQGSVFNVAFLRDK